MKQKPSSRSSSAKSVLRLPDLEHAKAAVWSDSFEMGLRFLYIDKESAVALKVVAKFVRGAMPTP
jgi:hypothetical protein